MTDHLSSAADMVGAESMLPPDEHKIIAACADLDARFEQIRFVHPRLLHAHQQFELMRLSVAKARELIAATGCGDGAKVPGFPMLILGVIAPSGSGKTANAVSYINEMNAHLHWHPGFRPLVYVELSPKADLRKLWTDILRGLGHPYPEDGTEERRREEVYRLMHRVGTQVLFLDEGHNINHREDGTVKVSVLDALKNLANSGLCAVVIMGVERMMPFFFDANAKEFISRCRPPILLTPLDRTIPEEWELFLIHLAKLDIALVEAGLTDAASRFHSEHADLLYDASFYKWGKYRGSIIGDASKIVRFSLQWMERRVARDPADEPRLITLADLERVIQRYVVPLKLGNENALQKRGYAPFLFGESRS